MAVSTTTVLDVPSLVSQLMAIERKPIDKLDAKVTDFQSKISSFGTLKGLVSTLQSALATLTSSLSGYSATSSNTSAFSATADSTAVAGRYSINVSHLAAAQSLVAAGQASSTSAITTADSTVAFVVNGVTTNVPVAANSTLEGIRDAINIANFGVSATIVNDGTGTPYRLAISANETGTTNAVSSITIQAGGDAALNTLLAFNPTTNAPASATLTEPVPADNASFSVNGIPIISATNTISNAIQGVTLTLTDSPATGTLTVARDTASIVDAATTFVEGYNALVAQLKSRSAYASSATSAAPSLSGDGTVRLMLDQLRGILSTAATGGTLSYMAQIGISVQSDSSLKLDSSMLNTAMANDFADVTNLLTSSSGFLTRLDTWATDTVDTGGLIDTRLATLNSSIDTYNDQIDKLQARMNMLEKQYLTTYTNLNVMLASMDNLSSYLTSQYSSSSSSSK